MASVTPLQLRSALTKYFNLGELRTLCFDLSIPYEDLEREGKRGKAESLVEFAERYDMFDTVVAYVQKARPHVDFGTFGDIGVSVTGAAKPQPPTPSGGTTINVHGNMIGSVVGDGSVKGGNIAGGNIVISHNYAEPTNKAEFAEQLVILETLLHQAIANGEIEDDTAVEDVKDAIKEAQKPEPSSRRLKNRLDDVKEVVEGASSVFDAARKAGTAVAKALPIISGLIKVATTIF